MLGGSPTDSSGSSTITGQLAVGTAVYAQASKSGYTAGCSATNILSSSNSATVYLTASQQQPVGTATVTVSVTCGGMTASSVSLTLCPSDQACYTGTTDGTGGYTFSNMPIGNYTISASKSGCNSVVNQALTVSVGNNPANVSMTESAPQAAAASADLVIYRYGNSEMRISGALVEFLNAQSTVVASGTTSAQGTVVVSGLSQGSTYTLRISASGYNTYTNSVTMNNAGVNYLSDVALTPTEGGAAPYDPLVNPLRVMFAPFVVMDLINSLFSR